MALALGLAAAATGSPWWGAAAATAGYALAWSADRLHRGAGTAMLALAAPWALAWLVVPSVMDWRAIVALAAAVAAWWPLWHRLGGRIPWQAGVAGALAGAALVLVALLTAVSPALVASDISARAQVMLVAAGAVLALPAWPWVSGRVRQRARRGSHVQP